MLKPAADVEIHSGLLFFLEGKVTKRKPCNKDNKNARRGLFIHSGRRYFFLFLAEQLVKQIFEPLDDPLEEV